MRLLQNCPARLLVSYVEVNNIRSSAWAGFTQKMFVVVCNNIFLQMEGIVALPLISIILITNRAVYRFINLYPLLSKVTDFKFKCVDERLIITGNGQQNTEWAQLPKYDIYRRGAICFLFSLVSLVRGCKYLPW